PFGEGVIYRIRQDELLLSWPHRKGIQIDVHHVLTFFRGKLVIDVELLFDPSAQNIKKAVAPQAVYALASAFLFWR
ncbi:hypothetical protein, partial [Shigella sp. FC1967]|uniref:hypothetical protein n=1 Tax=Shigella sp. FC1967 TaxID=1898041 RepID=UPI001C0A696D